MQYCIDILKKLLRHRKRNKNRKEEGELEKKKDFMYSDANAPSCWIQKCSKKQKIYFGSKLKNEKKKRKRVKERLFFVFSFQLFFSPFPYFLNWFVLMCVISWYRIIRLFEKLILNRSHFVFFFLIYVFLALFKIFQLVSVDKNWHYWMCSHGVLFTSGCWGSNVMAWVPNLRPSDTAITIFHVNR